MHYAVCFCEKCKRIGWAMTKKDKYDAVYRCKFCNSEKKIMKEDICGYIHNIPCFYFGSDIKKASTVVKELKIRGVENASIS